MEQVVIVGAGLGGLRTVESLRAEGFSGRISLVGDEPHQPYDRPPLSKQLLAGTWSEQRTLLHPGDLADLDVSVHLGRSATSVDPVAVHLDDGSRLPYHALVVATGVRPRRLPGQPDHPDLHVLRTLDDCRELRNSMSRARSLLVVGAGFIGAEVAATARMAGLEVTMLEALPVPFAHVLGDQIGQLCAQLHTDHGVTVRCGVSLVGFADSDNGIAARLADGTTVWADCGVVGVGTVIDDGWLAGLEVPTAGGLLCDTTGLVEGTSNVYAVGDIAAWQHPTIGDRPRIEHWTSATEQAAVVAQRLAGKPITRQADIMPYFWSDQYGLTLQLIGRCDLATSVEVLHDPGVVKGTVAGYFAGDTLVAVLAFHAPRLLNRYRRMVAAGASRHEVWSAAAELASR
ncbi:MAG TPA: FAD-dependent oxidoreductase [Pseudonocardiaceae bacterium]|nr:FAD-dependent oxidoreductase [Pseudonocardiaceae bacterium]